VSGDVYANPGFPFAREQSPSPALVFPRDDYRCFLQVSKFSDELATSGLVKMRFLAAWMDDDGQLFTTSHSGPYSVELKRRPAPAGYRFPEEYYEGEFTDLGGNVVGRVSIGRFSEWLRAATLEIDCVEGAHRPDPGEAPDWEKVMASAGWKLSVIDTDGPLPHPLGDEAPLELAELHELMLETARREEVDLDHHWYYHLLCVPRIVDKTRGYMYDVAHWDTNATPREGAAIATDDVYVNGENGVGQFPWLDWGIADGSKYGEGPAYYRVAVHEMGHAFGLDHNPYGTNAFMTITPLVADLEGFHWPSKINFEWLPEDITRLAHWPDPWVRPGGTPWESYSAPADAHEERAALLEVEPVVEHFPLGAPVRLNVSLTNKSREPFDAPVHLGVSRGSIRAEIKSPLGDTPRSLRSLAVLGPRGLD
jgi:hypothetical protein